MLSDDHQPLLVATEQNVLAAISHKTGTDALTGSGTVIMGHSGLGRERLALKTLRMGGSSFGRWGITCDWFRAHQLLVAGWVNMTLSGII